MVHHKEAHRCIRKEVGNKNHQKVPEIFQFANEQIRFTSTLDLPYLKNLHAISFVIQLYVELYSGMRNGLRTKGPHITSHEGGGSTSSNNVQNNFSFNRVIHVVHL